MISFSSFVALTEGFTRVPGTQYGSNPGGVFHDDSGEKHYIKFPNNPEQAKVEVATSQLYNHIGIKTLDPELHTDESFAGVRSKWQSNLSRIHPSEFEDLIKNSPKVRKNLLDLYHASAVTANWDAIGLEHDNVLLDKHTGHLVSVDQGGSMHFRAMGGHKDFPSDRVEESKSLLDPKYPAGHVFGTALKYSSPEDVSESKNNLATLTDDKIDETIRSNGLGQHIADTIKSRRDIILGK